MTDLVVSPPDPSPKPCGEPDWPSAHRRCGRGCEARLAQPRVGGDEREACRPLPRRPWPHTQLHRRRARRGPPHRIGRLGTHHGAQVEPRPPATAGEGGRARCRQARGHGRAPAPHGRAVPAARPRRPRGRAPPGGVDRRGGSAWPAARRGRSAASGPRRLRIGVRQPGGGAHRQGWRLQRPRDGAGHRDRLDRRAAPRSPPRSTRSRWPTQNCRRPTTTSGST